ncbi:hypothetical protein WME90_23780 [Sorangium sp. So ce375]|uniref:hypothetical protein n=1 Tax=Sorangium sp. So ce375 TaxID=3133306 RepID=UPI003F5C5B35
MTKSLRGPAVLRGGLELASSHPPGHAGPMGHPAEKRRRATYADLEAAPPNK